MNTLRKYLSHIRSTGARRASVVQTVSMGRPRVFEAFDIGADTFVFERGIAAHLKERPSVLVAPKNAMRPSARGWVLTLSTGNHAVAALPLLDGRFWGLSALPSARRSETLRREIICANVVGETIEISQRDVPTAALVAADAWLREDVGLSLDDVIMAERQDETLDYFRRLGQEWRVKPLAWTETEMRTALAAAKKRISTSVVYYHSAKGVHILTFPEFRRFAALVRADMNAFVSALKELVGVFEGNDVSFMRMPKHRGHHEIELFGLRRGTSADRLVPELEKLLEAIERGRLGQLGVLQRTDEIVRLYESRLARPELADEDSPAFVETLYMYVTGEIYAVVGEGSTPAFDDRRTALPGATFVAGAPVLHPGTDARTERLLANLRDMMSQGERVEYVNVYELRSGDDETPLGAGATREIVYRTNFRPLVNSLIEKRLSRTASGYADYMLARLGAMRALGVALSEYYRILKRREGASSVGRDYYIRRRCEGEPMESIPADFFRAADGSGREDREVVLALASLMGDAAAQTMVMKKFDRKSETPLYGIGKEIYAFAHDFARGRLMPKNVSICSIRGSFGWPILDQTEENFAALSNFYFGHFAHALKAFSKGHRVAMRNMATRFMDGFQYRTRELAWNATVMRDRFTTFAPPVPASYGFAARWRFVLWSLERQAASVEKLRRLFYRKVALVASECAVIGKYKGPERENGRGLPYER